MLTHREELELHVQREKHCSCLLGFAAAVFAAVVFMTYGLIVGSELAIRFGMLLLAVACAFFVLGRRPLRRIRELEEFL